MTLNGNPGPRELAGRARRTLATPTHASLHVGELTVGDRANVVLHDRNGTPTFLGGPDSAVAAAARRAARAVLSLRCPSSEAPARTVVISGLLTVLGNEHVDGARIPVCGLPPEYVYVDYAAGPDDAPVRHAVPLSRYFSAEDGLLDAISRRVQEHTNDSHEQRLRAFAARRSNIAMDDVAAAWLSRVDRCGAQLQWVDSHGAHTAVLPFPQPATCPRSLAAMLKQQLVD